MHIHCTHTYTHICIYTVYVHKCACTCIHARIGTCIYIVFTHSKRLEVNENCNNIKLKDYTLLQIISCKLASSDKTIFPKNGGKIFTLKSKRKWLLEHVNVRNIYHTHYIYTTGFWCEQHSMRESYKESASLTFKVIRRSLLYVHDKLRQIKRSFTPLRNLYQLCALSHPIV